MTRSSLFKSLWLLLMLAGVAASALSHPDARASLAGARSTRPRLAEARLVDLGGGHKGLADAGGALVPIRPYRRIASGGSVADELLLRLAEPERIVALSRYGHQHSRDAQLYGARDTLSGALELERLRRLRVDLLILNHMGSPAELARARDLGVIVFNLGEMRGLATLLPNIAAVAALLGEPERGARLAAQLERRMRAVAADIPAHARKRALYASAHGGQLFGGARRTSYHDVLNAAGLIDVAAAQFEDFPHYDPEQLLALDPDVVVTQHESVGLLCRSAGLDHLRACREHGVVGMDDALLGNPGLGMLEAAEELRERVYGPAR
jgi:iron complex transport system substrate-binding protein